MIEILSTFPYQIRYFDMIHFLPDTVLRKYMYMYMEF